MEVNFNNLRKKARYAYGRLANKLNNAIKEYEKEYSEKGTLMIDCDEIQSEMDDLKELIGCIAMVVKISERIDFLKEEIETYDFLSTTLTQEHQQSVKNDIVTKVEKMKRELTDCQSRMRLYEIGCFAF